MDTQLRQIFETYFQQQVERSSAFSVSDKLRLAEKLYQEAAEEGLVPIAPGQVARVPVSSARVQAILAGKEVALGGQTIQGQKSFLDTLNALPVAARLGLLIGVFALIMGLLWGIGRYQAHGPETEPSQTVPDGSGVAFTSPLASPTPSATPGDLPPTPTPYALVLDNAEVPEGPHDPVSLTFANLAFSLGAAQLEEGSWQPAVAEWLRGTVLRRVIAIPYSQEVGNAVAGMSYGDRLTLRLRSGEVVEYELRDIPRLQRHEIEILTPLTPSLVVILHSERAGERWVLEAEAIQEAGLSLPSPTLTPTPFLLASPTPTLMFRTPTPEMDFVPPIPSAEIFTDTLTVINTTAGLQLTVTNCVEVAQVGSATEGKYVVCEITLVAIQENVTYSDATLAVTERSQVLQIPGWWPEPLSVIGGIGNGQLAQVGDTVSGKVAGKIAKNQSDPVLIWEQAGARYVITLETLLGE